MDFIIIRSKAPGKADHGFIYVRIRKGDANRKFAAGFRILLSEWELYRSGRYNADVMMESIGMRYGAFANTLERIRQEVLETMSPQAVKSAIKAIVDACLNSTNRLSGNSQHLLIDYLNACIEDYRQGRRTKKGSTERVSKSIIGGLKDLRRNLMLFEHETGHALTLDEINMTFQQQFVSWCIAKGFYASTIHTFTTQLKTVMNLAFEERLTHNDGFMRSDFVTRQEVIEQVYLTPEQIRQLMTLDISSREKIMQLMAAAGESHYIHEEDLTPCLVRHLQQSRDIFVVGCLTGQRYSDYRRMTREMIVSLNLRSNKESPVCQRHFLKIYQTKTRKLVYIPLDYRVEEILDRYGGTLPGENLHWINLTIKFLGELLGWTHIPNIDSRRLGKKYGPRFCDMLSSHTARRSFATNAYAQGVPLSSIMAITGHSREEKLRIYLKLQAEDKALLAARDFKDLLKI